MKDCRLGYGPPSTTILVFEKNRGVLYLPAQGRFYKVRAADRQPEWDR